MALGFSSKAEKADSQSDNEKAPIDNYDPETAAVRAPRGLGGKPMNRIDGPLKARSGSLAGVDDSSSNDFSIGKQIEMEAENAIQYRTCSWPKVCPLWSSNVARGICSVRAALIFILDGCSAVL